MDTVLTTTDMQPTPHAGPAVFKAITESDIETQIEEMLQEFDLLVPEQYEGYDRPYQPLAKRMDLFEKHIPFGQMVIYTEMIEESKTNSHVYCRATFYILSDEGYLPLFSRLGEGSVMTARSDGPCAEAETSALRRMLIALGLSNDGGKDEIAVLNNNAERDSLTHYLHQQGKSLDALIKAFNAENPSKRISHNTATGNLTVAGLPNSDIVALRQYLNGKQEGES